MYSCKLHLEELALQDAPDPLDGRNLVVLGVRFGESISRNSAHVHKSKRRLSRHVRLTFVLRYTVHTMKDCHSCQEEKDASEHVGR